MKDRLDAIAKRKLEIRELLEDESKEVNVEEVKEELTTLEAEETQIHADIEKIEADDLADKEAKRSIIDQINKGSIEVKKVDVKNNKEERNMNEDKKFTVASPEYRTAWAKTLMKQELSEIEKKALGDAVTTTATTFVASESNVQGINNGGLFIPTSVRTDILNIIEQQSPFYRDVRKLAVAGNVDLPYTNSSDDAEWYAENVDTKNEGIEFAEVKLTSHELAKNVVVTWKLEKMAVESFIAFITTELATKMARAIVSAIIYGNGTNKCTGAIYNLTATTGEDPIDTIVKTYKTLSNEFRIGAKAYISTNVNIDIVGYKDLNDNYPFLNGVSATKLVTIEVDPFLVDGDIIVGNPANYILNTITDVELARESKLVGRKTVYGAYGEFDGKPRPGAFKKGSYETQTA